MKGWYKYGNIPNYKIYRKYPYKQITAGGRKRYIPNDRYQAKIWNQVAKFAASVGKKGPYYWPTHMQHILLKRKRTPYAKAKLRKFMRTIYS